jgi:hypothetical protein
MAHVQFVFEDIHVQPGVGIFLNMTSCKKTRSQDAFVAQNGNVR